MELNKPGKNAEKPRVAVIVAALCAAALSTARAETPDAFLEYVASTGQQYVDTGVRAKSGIRAEMGMMWTADSQFASFLGAKKGNDNFLLCYLLYWEHWTYYYGEAQEYLYNLNSSIKSRSLDKYYEVAAEYTADGRFAATINGATATATPAKDGKPVGALDTGLNLYLFARNLNGTANHPSAARCYYLKIWTNGVNGVYVLARDFKPCKDPSGTVALYDTVSKEYFYPNTGTLTEGPEIATGGEEVAWTGAAGTFALDNAANWSSGKVPSSANTVTIPVGDGETVFTASSALAFGDVKLIGTGTATIPANVAMKSLDIAPYATARFTAAPGVADGGLKGAGALVLDPGAGNTFTMSKENNDFTGEAVVKSGIVRLGNATSFGPLARASFIRVKGGATLDEGDAASQAYDKEKNKVILEEGASFVYSGVNDNPTTHAVSTLTLEGNATVDTSIKDVAIGRNWNWDYSHINLGANTLTVKGDKTFYISTCTISGTGTIDIQDGTTVASTHAYNSNGYNTTCANGTIRIREGGTWRLMTYQQGCVVRLSTKNLILDGQVVRDANTYILTVTGSITGNGTTPVLTLAEGAVFKPTGTGYLTIAESLSGTMTIDLSGLDLSVGEKLPLFKVGSAEMLPAESAIQFADGTRKGSWSLRKTPDGLGYDLARSGISVILR